MKKRIIALLLCIVSLVALFAFAGCDKSVKSDNGAALELNVKYIHEGATRIDEDFQTYFVFTSQNEGYYVYYYSYSSLTEHYKVNFIYIFEADTVLCFYDSVEYFSDHNDEDESSTWNFTLLPTENCLMSVGNTYYINENFLDEIPNYGK